MSRYNHEFDMKYTDNPYIDLIVNCVKILGMNAVVKNENQALHYEDVRSSMAASNLIKYKEGAWSVKKDGEFDDSIYFEWNSYYRMLNGLPPAYTLNDENAYLEATGLDDAYEYIGGGIYIIPDLYRRYFIDLGKYDEKYEGRYLHELNEDELAVISVKGGLLDRIKDEYCNDTHYSYIYHLGDKRIDYYTARKATNFSLLYLPKLDTFDIIENKFRRYYNRNRKYTMSTVYSEAYRFMSYHYDAFIQILIIIQTMVDMISEVQEYVINKDVFDSRTIRYLFESYGIAYYKEIPVKYQIRIIKNVNRLLKYKSSHRNITDILELFDDDTITVYTYYLMKTKRINRDEFFYYTEDDINPKYINDKTILYLGRPKDISNNKVPVMPVQYNKDDTEIVIDGNGNIVKDNFVRRYVYNYLLDPYAKDVYENRKYSDSLRQPITSYISEPLKSLDDANATNGSILLDFFNKIAIGANGLPWFGMEKYNVDPIKPESNDYMRARNKYLSLLKESFTRLIMEEINKNIIGNPDFAINMYNYRKLKYLIYGRLGIFDYDESEIDFDNDSDAKLSERFYTKDSLITEKYCIAHNISNEDYEYFLESDDRHILNHTIPFFVWNGYKKNDKKENVLIQNEELYIFNANGYITAKPYNLDTKYLKYVKAFREEYIIAVKTIVEAVFEDMRYDALNNPTPRYGGWLDIGYVVSKTGKSLDEIKLGDEIVIDKGENIPLFNSSYVSEVVTEDMIGTENFKKNYDLCFLKVPILDPNAYSVIEQKDARRNYDTITLADPFWDGVTTFDILTDEERDKLHQAKRQEILSKEFTIERTKYIAVEANIDLVKMSYQISYFMNMLYDKHKDEEGLVLDVDRSLVSSGRAKLNDLLTFAIALNFIYNGTEPDNIASDMEKNMYINGFNFDTDWSTIYNYLENKHFINHNYGNEIHDYSYINEFGEKITNTGYGMSPMNKGWLTELFEDFVDYGSYYIDGKEINVRQYFGQPIYGYNENNDPIFYYPDEENKPEGEPINSRIGLPPDHSIMPDNRVGAFLSGRYEECTIECGVTREMGLDFGSSDIWNFNLKHHPIVSDIGELQVVNIAWEPTQYPDTDNNSHGLWLDTKILTAMEDKSTSDLEKMNMLKNIYYSNTNLYNHLTYMLRNAENKRMYDIYKILFDSFMETKINHEFYGQTDVYGNPVYTNKNNQDDLYYITSETEYSQDEYGFPIYKVIDKQSGDISYCKFDYRTALATQYETCRYIDVNNRSISFDCIRNARNEYVVFYNDDELKLKQDVYFSPDSPVKLFEIDSVEKHYLVRKDNMIKLEVECDSEGLPIIDGYKFILDESGNYVIHKIVDGEPEKNTDIIIIRKIASNYYDFLEFRNPSLYSHLIDLKYNYKNIPSTFDSNGNPTSYVPGDDKRKHIEVLCEMIESALEKYFEKKEWRYLFNLIPTSNIQNIQNYIMKMVVFFKSWKTQILDTSINYVLDDPYSNYVHIIDDMYYNTTFDNMIEKISPKEYKYFSIYTEYKDPAEVGENVEIEEVIFEPYTIDFGFGEKMYGNNFDYPILTSKLIFKDNISPGERVEFKYFKDVSELNI